MKDKHAAEDIWHLTIDDLLAPPPETPRLGGQGPFVINLSASTAPISIPPKNVLGFERMHVYQVTRTEDGRQRFRLRLGPISTELEADALLASLREVYPGAMTATAAADDLRAIASATRIAESGTRPALKPPPKSTAKPATRRLPIPSKHVVKNEALETTGSGWDLDALLPHLAAKTPAPPTKKAPPKMPVEARTVAAAPAPAPQASAARPTPALRTKPPIVPAAKAAAPAKKAPAPVMKPVSAPPAAGHSAPTEWYEATQPMNAAPAAQAPVASIPVLSIPVLRNEVMPGTGEIVPTVIIEKAQAPQSTPAVPVPASPVIEPAAVIAAPEPVAVIAAPEPVAVVVTPTVIESAPTSRIDVDAVAAAAAAPAAPAAPLAVVPVPTFTSIGQEFGPSAFGHKIELTGRFAQVEPVTQPRNTAPEPLPDPLETDWAAILSAPIEATGTRPALGALLESAVAPATVTPAMVAQAMVTPAPTVAPAPVASNDDSGLTNLVARSNALVESLDSQFDPAATLPAAIAADPVTVAPTLVATPAIEPAVIAPAAVEPIVVAAPVDGFVAVEPPVIAATAVESFAVEPPVFTSTQTIEQKLAALAGILAEAEALPATATPVEMGAPVMPMPTAIEPAPAAIAPAPVAVESTPAASSAVTSDANAQTGRVPVLQSAVEDIDVDISFDDDLLSAVPLRAHPWPEIERRQEPRPSLKSPTDVLTAIEDMVVVDEANNLENLVDNADAGAVSIATHAEAPVATPAPAASVPTKVALPAASVPLATASPVETLSMATAAPVDITPVATAAPVEVIAAAAPAPVEDIVAATSVPAVEAAQPIVAPIVANKGVDEIVVEGISVDIASSVEVLMLKTSAVLDALDSPAEPVPAPSVDEVAAPVAEAFAAFVEYVEPTVVLEPKGSAPVAVVPAPEPIVLSLAPDVAPATPAARDDTPAWAASSIDLELVPDAPAPIAAPAMPSQQAKNNVVPPGAVRGARPAKKARSAGKPSRPACTIIAPAKAAAPAMNATPPAAPAHAAAAKSAPPATKVAPPTGRPQAPAKSARPHAPVHAAMPAPAAAHQAKTAKPAERKATIDSRPAPAVDSTQTLHALAPLELAPDDASRWFVVQLELSENEIDPEHVPSLDIFEAYRLYTVTGLIDGKLMHALRLGFFNDDISAQAVGAYLKSFFEAPAIKRVSSAERERFAERQVVPRKDVGATGLHSVIEMSSPRPVPEMRLADLAEGSSQRAPEEKSIWSRLVAPLKR